MERIKHEIDSEVEKHNQRQEQGQGQQTTRLLLDRCRELLKEHMLKFDFSHNLDPRGNKYSIQVQEKVIPGIIELARLVKEVVRYPALNELVELKIERNRLPAHFIAIWKGLEKAGLITNDLIPQRVLSLGEYDIIRDIRRSPITRLSQSGGRKHVEIVHCKNCNAEIRQLVDSDGLRPAPPPGGWKCYECIA